MARLPVVGGDRDNWGQILNDYLSVEHNADGTLKLRTDGSLSNNIADGSVTAAKLSPTVNNYLASAQTAVQSVNGESGQAITLTASDVSAIATSAAGAASGVATLDGSSKLTASQLPDGVETTALLDSAGHAVSSRALGARGHLPKAIYCALGWEGVGGDGPTIRKNLQSLVDMGVEIVRMNLKWESEAYAGEGTFYGFFDICMDIIEEMGIKAVVSIETTPSWARSHGNVEAQADDLAKYADFCGQAAARYKGRVYAWQIWNEPNEARYWNGTISGAAYASMVALASPQIRSADPEAMIIAAGVASRPSGTVATQGTGFLGAMIDAGIDSYVDAYDFHSYPVNGASPDTLTGSGGTAPSLSDFRSFELAREVMVSKNVYKPLWVTEFGWTTAPTISGQNGAWMTGVSEDLQASYTARALEIFDETPYVDVAMVFVQRDFGSTTATSSSNPTDYMGIYRYDWTPKPLAGVMMRRPRAGLSKPASSLTANDTGLVLGESDDAVETTIPRVLADSSFTLTSGTLWLTHFTARRTAYLNSFKLMAGPTPSSGSAPTLLQCALFEINADGSMTRVSVTSHDATLLNSAYKVSTPTTGFIFMYRGRRYAWGVLCITSGVAPTIAGQVLTQGATAWASPSLATKVTGLSSMPSSISAGSLVVTGERALAGFRQQS